MTSLPHSSDGNLSLAAKSLGVGRSTLYRKLEGYGLAGLLTTRKDKDGETRSQDGTLCKA